MKRKFITCVVLLEALVFVHAAIAQNTAAVQYFYDQVGRLVKVVDQNGNVATYSYDAADNILSISRSTVASPNSLAILNFLPPQGGIGATVTIQGQNFSTIPTNNMVQLNGAPATVTSATANSLTVLVPSGATTGPITVSVGSATATTSSNFTVLQGPVITSISPKSALQGATVSNFQVTGLNLTGVSFSFLPSFVPAAITPSNVAVSPDGTSATMSLTLSASAAGSFLVAATNPSGSSSQVPAFNNTLTVLSNTPSADADGDGLTNIYEAAIGSNPLNPSTANDGIPDGWALFFGLNPSNPAGASQTAPDGLTYLQAFQQGLNPLIANLAPPAVARVFPADGAINYPTNGVVVVRYNEPLQAPVTLAASQAAINAALPPGSNFSSTNSAVAAQALQGFLLRTCCLGTTAVPNTVQLLQNGRPIGGTVTLSDDGLSLVFAPTRPLSSSTTYTVLVQGAKAASGVSMTGTFQSSFTTGLSTNLTTGTTVLTSPPNFATGVPTNAAFMIEFNKQVDPASLTPQTFFVTDLNTGKNVPGMLQVDASGFTASFVPLALYDVDHFFQVTITGVLDLSENRFPTNFFGFTTGFSPITQGPALVATSPGNGAANVPVNSLVVAQFSEPVSVVTATTGFRVLQGNTPIAGAIALSNGNTQATFTPVFPLNPNTVYTIAATAQITDVAANPLSNPGTFTFVTGATGDNTTPFVTSLSPDGGASGVPTNAVIQLQFSKPVDPLTVRTADFQVFPRASGIPVSGTVSVSTDGLTATFTPTPPLDPATNYTIRNTSGIADQQGHPLSFFESDFTTALGAATTAPTVVQVSPANGASGVPVNPQVVVVVSAPVSAASVNSSAITVTVGGTPVNGSTRLGNDRTTLTFVPTNLLAVSTAYNVAASGFTDQAGNTVTPFTSTFTTGTSGVANTTRPTVTAVSPANGATGVSTSSQIVLTFNEAINAATLNFNTVFAVGSGEQLAGNYAVDGTGTVVTFTPVSPLPGNTSIAVVVQGVTDLSGNSSNFFESSFITATGTDTTTPKVLMVAPSNGATGVGLNATVVLSFSKSMKRSSINTNTVALLANGNRLSAGIDVSADNRVVMLSPGTLPASSTVTVIATSGVTDLVGNALGNFESSFTTAQAFDTDHPAVVTQRPGNGATGVPLNTSVVLYINEPMNASTVSGALHVSQNGVLVSGTTQASDSGQVVVFTPSTPWLNNALIQVFVDGTAQDIDGNSLSTYQGLFITTSDTSSLAPAVVSVSPQGAINTPTNVVVDIGFNEPLNPATMNTTTVSLLQNTLGPNTCCNFVVVPSTVSLLNGGTVVRITPNSSLTANNFVEVQINSGLQGANGRSFQADPFGNPVLFFTTGANADTATPSIISVSPPNGTTNVGDNAEVRVVFNKPISPLTVNATTIQLTGGGTTQLPDSISFSNNNQNVVLVPHGPLPDNTLMTLTISGITDQVGNAVPAQTTTFTTGTGPDLVAPAVVNENPFNGAQNVPLNSPIMLQTSEPIDPSSVNQNTLFIRDEFTGQSVGGSYSVSPDGLTISFLPSAPLAVGRRFSVFFNNRGITDLAGNLLSCAGLCDYLFTAGTTASTGPGVLGVSPANGLTGVAINSQIVVQFSEPVDAVTIGQVTLTGGGTVNVISRLSNANQTLTLVPVVPLNANTTYTINVIGVQDLGGNPLTLPSTTTFTTGAGADLTPSTVTTVSPSNGAGGVPTNAAIQLRFSKQVDPLTVSTTDFLVFPQATGIPTPGLVSTSADALTATFTPNSPLAPSTNYSIQATGAIADLPGHPLPFFSSSFTTGLGAVTTAPTVVEVSPPNGTSGVPVNPQVVVVLSAPVSTMTASNNSITVTAGGTPVSGNVSLSNDQTTLTFTPTNLLAVSTTYTVTASGLADLAGNIVVPFNSTFTTGTSGVANTSGPTVTSMSPAKGARGVPTNSAIVLTFSEVIDVVTVNASTVRVFANGFVSQLAGSYTVDATGQVVTFTPVSALPGNTLITVAANGVRDLSGNPIPIDSSCECAFQSSFTTAVGTDTTSPTVLMITPSKGATGIGLNVAVVLTFSKSLNQNTINNNTVALIANGSRLGIAISVSADNRVVTLSAGTLPSSSTVTVVATAGITDLVGNALANFESSFTTAPAFDKTHPAVVTQRPGNGAGGVPLNSSVVLYLSEPMNAATVQGALHVSQNGVLTSGTTQVSDSGQVVVFTPSTFWQNNALIQVFLDGTARDVDGNSLSPYQGTFRTVTDAANLVGINPPFGLTVPTNVLIELGFSEALNPATVNTGTVTLFQQSCCPSFPVVPITVNLLNDGTVVQITPNTPLAANTTYQIETNNNSNQQIQGSNGVPVPSIFTLFRTGAGADTISPTVTSVSPPNGSKNVGDNAVVRVMFSKPVNPLTVNGTTIQLSGGGTTAVPDSISFGSNNQTVQLVPHAPLPDNTQMTLAISGVTDVAGNAVTPQATTFTTGTGPDVVRPSVINESPSNGASNVPLNTLIMLETSKPIDPATVNSNTLRIITNTGRPVPGSYSVTPDGQTISFLPNPPLVASQTFLVLFDTNGITDLTGNLLGCANLCTFIFTTGTTANTTGPSVVGVSPTNGLTGVPINAQVVVQFSEPVDAVTVNQVTLSSGGAVNVISQLSNANQTLTLIPVVPLNPNTTYTVNVTGVQDLSGNPLTAPSTTTFTTADGVILTPLRVTTASPASGEAGVPINSAIQMQFSNGLDKLTVTAADFRVVQQATGISVPGTTSISPDGITATFTPTSALSPSTSYFTQATSSILDLVGQSLQSFFSSFQTGTGANSSGPSVVGLSPGNALTGVPTNTQVLIQFSEPVNALTLNQIALSSGAPVNVISHLSNGNRTLILLPVASLNPNTTYTLNVSGVLDLSGNALIAPSTTTFTTGAGPDSSSPFVMSVSPTAGATAVLTTSVIQLQFSKQVDPLTVTTADFLVFQEPTFTQIPGIISVSADGLTATFTASTPLLPSTGYFIEATNGILDLEGQSLQSFFSSFTSGTH